MKKDHSGKKYQPLLEAVDENMTRNQYEAMKKRFGRTWIKLSAAPTGSTYGPLAETFIQICRKAGIDPREAISKEVAK